MVLAPFRRNRSQAGRSASQEAQALPARLALGCWLTVVALPASQVKGVSQVSSGQRTGRDSARERSGETSTDTATRS